MFLHIFEPKDYKKITNLFFIMLSQILDKMAEKGPLKTLKKYSKKNQKHEIVYIFGEFQGLNNLIYQLSEATV